MRKYEMKEIHKLKLLPHSFLPSSHNSHLTQSFPFNVYSFSFFIHMYTAYCIPYNIFATQHLRHYKMSVKCLYLHLYKMLQTFHFNSSSSRLFHSAHKLIYMLKILSFFSTFHFPSLLRTLFRILFSLLWYFSYSLKLLFFYFSKNKMGMKWMDGAVTTKYFYESTDFWVVEAHFVNNALY